MSDLKYLDYNGLITYTDHVKDFVNSKIVYLEDESQIPDPPVEGTLYVIGSNILLDEELIYGTQPSFTVNWTGNSIDTQLHNGKRIVYWLPLDDIGSTQRTLTLTFSDENNTQSDRIPIYREGGIPITNEYIGASLIRMTYLENVTANGVAIPKGWWCESIGKKYNKINLTARANSSTSFTCNETISIPRNSWCHVRLTAEASSHSLSSIVPFGAKLANSNVIYDMVQGVLSPLASGSPGQVDMWYYNNTSRSITAQVSAYTASTNITLSSSMMNPLGDTLTPASYYEIIQ